MMGIYFPHTGLTGCGMGIPRVLDGLRGCYLTPCMRCELYHVQLHASVARE